MPPDEFEATADRFFARTDEPVRGRETARAAQARIFRAVTVALTADPCAPTAIISHGAVGTLLWLALRGEPIGRAAD